MRSNKNPWLGLKTYEEGDVMYGRVQEIKELSQDILYNVQTVIYGKSGIGKSSILSAGIFPIIRSHNYFPIKIRLVHRNTRLSYTQQIYRAVFENLMTLRKTTVDSEGKTVVSIVNGSYRETISAINPDTEGLWEFFHRHEFFDETGKPIKPVLVIDQFEEIFTLTAETERAELVRNFFNELADLINDIKPDYIYEQKAGVAEDLAKSNECVNEDSVNDELLYEEEDEERDSVGNKYLTENNCHIVISIREDFLSHLERNIDNIPLLKHNRFCLKPLSEDQAANVIMNPCPGLISTPVAKEIISKITGVSSEAFEIDESPEIEVDSAILSLFLREIYEKTDGGIITNEVVEEYGSNIIQQFYERTMQNVSSNCVEYLEKRLITEEGRRDNIDKNRALRHLVTEAELDILKDARIIREFPWNNEMRIEFIHDVLCGIIVKRRDDRKKRKQQEEEEHQFRKRAEQLKQRNKQLVSLIVGIVVSLIILSVVVWDGMFREIGTRYEFVIKRNGWFEGLKELDEEEASYRNYYYVLKKNGRWSTHAHAMEARNGYGDLTTNHGMTPYILNKFDYTDNGADKTMRDRLLQVCQWEFIADQDGDFVIQERALDKNENLVYSYNRALGKEKNKVVGTYTDENGFPIILRDSCYFYLLTTYNNAGFEVLQEYYNDRGEPIPNKDGGYKTRWTYTGKGMGRSEASLFFTGERMIDRAGNCGWLNSSFLDDDSLYVTEAVSFNADSIPTPTITARAGGGVAMKRYEYDEHYRVIKQTHWDENGNPCYDVMGVHAYKNEYNRHGQQIHCYRLDTLGNIVKDKDGFIDYHQEYDEFGNEIVNELIASKDTIRYANRYKYDYKQLLLEHDVYSIYGGDTVYNYRYLNDTVNRVKYKRFYDADSCVIREGYDERNNCIYWSYYDITNTNPIELYGYHTCEYEYQYDGKQTLCVESYFDINHYRCNENGKYWSYRVISIDSLKMVKEELYYDSLKNFVLGVRGTYSDDFLKMIRTESISESKNVKRSSNNSVFFYCANYVHSVKTTNSDKVVAYSLNEFGEPSLMREWDKKEGKNKVYHASFLDLKSGNVTYFNERGELIVPTAYMDSVSNVAIVEMKSFSNIGFEDGDIILKCNDWQMDFEGNPYNDLSAWFNYDIRKFYVARFNKGIGEYDIVIVEVGDNVNIEQFIKLQKYYCTKKEEKRLRNLIQKIDTGDWGDTHLIKSDSANAVHSVVCGRIERDGQMRDLGYKEGTFFVLKWCDWTHEQSVDEFGEEFVQEKENPKKIVLLPFEQKGEKIEFGEVLYLDLSPQKMGLRLFDISVLESLYQSEIKARYDKWLKEKQSF